MTRTGLLFRALVWGPLRSRPGQAGAMTGAIALGVAMVSAIHWINASALHSFELGAEALSGRADAALVPASGALDEHLLASVRDLPEVVAAFPAIRMEVATDAGGSLPLLGVDLLREAGVRGGYLPERVGRGSAFPDLLRKGAVLLGERAAEELDLAPGSAFLAQAGAESVRLRVVGELPPGSFWARGAVMDIATAQWTFGRIGELDRIDVILRESATAGDLAGHLESLPGGGQAPVTTPAFRAERMGAMTRAYRTNLRVLALVGLVTAAFLVYSLLTLSMRRRRRHFALVRVLGMERRRLAGWLLLEGLLVGALGGALGLSLGLGAAWIGVEILGGDLGAGYFEGVRTRLHAEAEEMLLIGGLGVLGAVAGTVAPVLDNVRQSGEAAIRRGSVEGADTPRTARRVVLAVGALAGAGGLAVLPPWEGLPLPGYGALALVLGAALLLAPVILRGLVRLLPTVRANPVALVARAQLLGAPRRAAMAVSAILVSFALLVAMASLVHSFRGSVEDWLNQILAADLYVRGGPSGPSAFIPEGDWGAIAGWETVRRLDPLRRLSLDWAPRKGSARSAAPVRLTARRLHIPETRSAIELLKGRWPDPENGSGVLVSEVFARGFGVEPGDKVRPPLGGARLSLSVTGVWRDFSYRGGHVLMDRKAFAEHTGNRRADQLALYLEPNADPGAVRARLEAYFRGVPGVEVADARQIRRQSLRVFDRTFAVTYVLVVLALAVGLVGTLLSLAVQGLERRGELAMLRYVGFRIRDVAGALSVEGALVAALGGLIGLTAGVVLAVILIEVVNEQSFLWSLPVELPWGLLAAAGLALVAATGAGGWLVGRSQARQDPTRAVGED